MSTATPFSKPVYVMLKPAGARCNLACRYCYYLPKQELYAGDTRHWMSTAVLERFTEQYIAMQTMPEVLFTWHGGEALLRDRRFYEDALRLQQRYAQGHLVSNSLQTNGTLLTDDWCRFLHDNQFLVGLSIDGPAPYHDAYRTTPQGQPTHERVLRAIERLDRFQVEWNAMAVVNNLNVHHPEHFYQFFKQIGCRFIQFAPIVESRNTDPVLNQPLTDESITAEQWSDFLCRMFDLWVRRDVGQVFVQLFDATLANWVGATPGICTLTPTCGHAAVMEWNGDVYACDHFVWPEHRLGNIMQKPLMEMLYSPEQSRFGEAKHTRRGPRCQTCPYWHLCYAECPKNRYADGSNHLCDGYRRFFEHTAPAMRYMARCLAQGIAPATIMTETKVLRELGVL